MERLRLTAGSQRKEKMKTPGGRRVGQLGAREPDLGEGRKEKKGLEAQAREPTCGTYRNFRVIRRHVDLLSILFAGLTGCIITFFIFLAL